ncbi:hypothetical protein [Lentzea guizhouensis]|uniref:ATP dependent DNA ligase n=1 Tax=Lentzea guizhouensis TaxID=1586287 RepID=UPI0008FF655F
MVYVGHVRTGFGREALVDLQRRLDPQGRSTSPYDLDMYREHARDARWVEPVLVGEVEFRQWTTDGHLRHSSWCGLRLDRDPSSVGLPAQPPDSSHRKGSADPQARTTGPVVGRGPRRRRAQRTTVSSRVC